MSEQDGPKTAKEALQISANNRRGGSPARLAKTAKPKNKPTKKTTERKPIMTNEGFGSKTAEMLMQRGAPEQITLSTGAEFIIKKIDIGDFYISHGHLLPVTFLEQYVLNEDDNQEDVDVDNLSTKEKLDMVNSRFAIVKEVVVAGVLNCPFSSEPEATCPDGMVSVDKLTRDESTELFNAITGITIEADDEDTFRESDTEDTQPVTE